MCEVCSFRDTSPNPVFYTIDIDESYPAQLTNLSESELSEIVQRMHISEIFETEEDDEALEKTEITDILFQEAQGYLTVGLNPDDDHP